MRSLGMRAHRTWMRCALSFALVLTGCGGDSGTPAPDLVGIEVAPAATLATGVGEAVSFTATAWGSSGELFTPRGVSWTSSEPSVASIDGSGRATALAMGTTTVTASAGGVSGSATLEVWLAPEVAEYVPGTRYLGRESYVEYIPGRLPVVISAPHGGSLTPGEIPDRTYGTLVTDSDTEETLMAVRDAFIARTGEAPHVVLSHLRRTKLDPNREMEEAAQGSPFAENAWNEFHGYIETAEHAVEETFGSGLYIDLHGHGHEIQRAELGYLLSANDLDRPDAELDDAAYAAKSSVRALYMSTGLPFSQLIRGPTSFGAYLALESVPSVPSPADPSPGTDPYFSGGYSTLRHGSRAEGAGVSGIQLELHRPGLRDTQANREAFAARLAAAVEAYLLEHYGFFEPGPR